MKQGFVGLIFLCCSVALQAQEAKTLLWGVTGNGIADTSFVFGTIHILCPDDLDLDGRVQGALKSSERLILELDFDDPQLQMQILQMAQMPDEKKLSDLLTEEEMGVVRNFFMDSLQMPIDMLMGWKPFLLSTFPMLHILKCTPVSVEQELIALVEGEEIEVLGLETVAEQMAVIDGLPLDKQAKALIESIVDYNNSVAMTGEMYNLYGAEDVGGLFGLTEEYFDEDYSEIEFQLLEERNSNWIPRIEKLIKEDKSFIAVGAAHLGGEIGILSKLSSAGYTVFPVLKQ